MRPLIPLFLLVILSNTAFALESTVTYEGKGRFKASAFGQSPLRKSKIFEIVTDLENQCMQGCTYYLPSIRESVILERVSENEFYTWTYVDDLMDSQFLSKIIVEEDTVTYSTPTNGMINSLEKSRYKHKPIFQKRMGQWRVEEVSRSDGKFSHTNIYFKLDVTAKSRLVRTFKGRVKKKIKSGIKDNYKLFRSR